MASTSGTHRHVTKTKGQHECVGNLWDCLSCSSFSFQLPQNHVEVEVSYIEIYNERIYDLLGSGGGGCDRREALRVREHPDTGPYVEGVACHLVSSYESLQVSNMQTLSFTDMETSLSKFS